jgi:hypothetical protein
VAYYVSDGAQSLRNHLTNNSKALRVWNAKVKVDDEAKLRSTYAETLSLAMSWRTLPDAPAAAIAEIGAAIDAVAQGSASSVQVPALTESGSASAELLSKAFHKSLEERLAATLAKMRTLVYGSLKYDADNLYALSLIARSGGGDNSSTVKAADSLAAGFEDLAVELLSAGLTMGLDRSGDLMGIEKDERLAAAAALVTYRGIVPKFEEAVAGLSDQAGKAKATGDARVLAAVREVQQALK